MFDNKKIQMDKQYCQSGLVSSGSLLFREEINYAVGKSSVAKIEYNSWSEQKKAI